MIFLIDYDRSGGQLVSLRAFDDGAGYAAAEARLALELDLKEKGIEHEVVLLEATSEDALRKTHRRYFETVRELAQSHETFR